MRASLLGLAVLLVGLPAMAEDERPCAVVGQVQHLGTGAQAEVTVHRLGGTEPMGGFARELDEAIVRTVETDAEGRFEVGDLEAGVYALVARVATTLAGDAVVRVYAGARREANVSLEPARSLSGTVRFADGRPVEGIARFRVRRSGSHAGSGPWHPWQDAEPVLLNGPTFETKLVDGTFRIGLTSKPTDITILTPDGRSIRKAEAWRPTETEVEWTIPDPDDAEPARVAAPARPVPAVVEGRVAHDGRPVVGARVFVVPAGHVARGWWGEARHTLSDAHGRYRIDDVPPGPAALFVRGGGFASVDLARVRARGPNPFTISLLAGGTATRDLEVEPATRLLGRVVDHAGGPVVGATVRAIGVTGPRYGEAGFRGRLASRAHTGPFVATTDDDGRFRFEDLVPGHLLSMRVDAPGMPLLGSVARPTVDASVHELRFQRPRHLTVRAVDAETGGPVPGARVSLEEFAASRRTGADGRARFGPFGDGRIRIQVDAEGFVPVVGIDVEGSADGPGPFDVTIPLERGLTITGRVLDGDGQAVARAHVSALHVTDRRSGRQRYTSSDAEGRFVLRGLFAGDWQLTVQRREHPREQVQVQAQVQAEAGASDVVVRFEAQRAGRRVFNLRVTDPEGHAVPQAQARLVGVRGHSARAAVRDGEVKLDTGAIDAAEFEQGNVFAYVRGARSRRGNERLPFGAAVVGPLRLDERDLTLALPPEQTITGRVLTREGEPVVGARLVVLCPLPGPLGGWDADRLGGSLTDEEGRFTVRYLGAGTHGLEVDAGTRFLHALQEAEAGARDVDIHLAPATSVEVVVVDPDGRPVPGAMLRLSEATRDRRARREDDAGEGQVMRHRALRSRDSFTAADDGSVVLEGLVPGRVYDVRVYGPRDDVQNLRLVDWAPVSGEVRMQPGIVIAGRVVDEDGEPARDAVAAVDGDQRWSGKRCDAEGAFRFTRLPPGTYRVLAGRQGMPWEDPSVQVQVVEGGVEDLVVRVPTPFFEDLEEERRFAIADFLPDALEVTERPLGLLLGLARVETLQQLETELPRRPAPLLHARGVWPRRDPQTWPAAALTREDVEGLARVVPGADTFGLRIAKRPLPHLLAAQLPPGDRRLWEESARRAGTYESFGAVVEALAVFLGDTTGFVTARRSEVFDRVTYSGFYAEPDQDPEPGPAIACVAPLRPDTLPGELEAWLGEHLAPLVGGEGFRTEEHQGVRYRCRGPALGWDAVATPWLGAGLAYAVTQGHLVVSTHEGYLRSFLDTLADPVAHPPLMADATFAPASGDLMRGAHAFVFVDYDKLGAVPSETGEGAKGILWDRRNLWVQVNRSPRDAAIAHRKELLEQHRAKHERAPSPEERDAIDAAVDAFADAHVERYAEFEQEYGRLLRGLDRLHALTLSLHVSGRFVHGEMVLLSNER